MLLAKLTATATERFEELDDELNNLQTIKNFLFKIFI